MTDSNAAEGFEPQTDLFRAPIQNQQLLDNQPSIVSDPGLILGVFTFIRQTLRLLWTIAPKPRISSDLSTNGRFMASHYHGYLGLITCCFQQGVNLVSLRLGKLFVTHCAPLSWWTEKAVNHTAAYSLSNSSRVALTS